MPFVEQPIKISWVFEFHFPLAKSKTKSLTWDGFKNRKKSVVSHLGVSHISILPTLSLTWTLMGGRVNLFDAKSNHKFFWKVKLFLTLKQIQVPNKSKNKQTASFFINTVAQTWSIFDILHFANIYFCESALWKLLVRIYFCE